MPDFVAMMTPFINMGIAIAMIRSYVTLERRLSKLEITQELLIDEIRRPNP